MTISFEGIKELKDDFIRGLDKNEEKAPIETGAIEGTAGALLTTTGVLAVRSGIKRLASCESTYGGFGPVLTTAFGVVSGVAGVVLCKRTYECARTVIKEAKVKAAKKSELNNK